MTEIENNGDKLFYLSILNAIILAVMFIFSGAIYTRLSGAPASDNLKNAMLLPIVGLAYTIFMHIMVPYAVKPLLERGKPWVSIPRKDEFLLLPKEKKVIVYTLMKKYLIETAVITDCLVLLLQVTFYKKGVNDPGPVPYENIITIFIFFAYAFFTIKYVIDLYRLTGYLTREDALERKGKIQ